MRQKASMITDWRTSRGQIKWWCVNSDCGSRCKSDCRCEKKGGTKWKEVAVHQNGQTAVRKEVRSEKRYEVEKRHVVGKKVAGIHRG
jgi:hypothetical protein